MSAQRRENQRDPPPPLSSTEYHTPATWPQSTHSTLGNHLVRSVFLLGYCALLVTSSAPLVAGGLLDLNNNFLNSKKQLEEHYMLVNAIAIYFEYLFANRT